MSDSIDLVARAARGDFSPEVLDWLRVGIARYLSDGSALDQCLDLDRGSRHRARNAALDDAALALDDGCTRWALACRLAEGITYFETRLWPRVRAGVEIDMTPLNGALLRLFLARVSFPRTARKLYDWLSLTDQIHTQGQCETETINGISTSCRKDPDEPNDQFKPS